MKIITTIIAAAATIATAQAELMPKQFAQLETWAKKQDYSYQTTSIRYGRECFLFQRNKPGSPTDLGFALVPTSSDTADEAINAFIASVTTVTAMEDIAVRNQIRAQASVATQDPITAANTKEEKSDDSAVVDFAEPQKSDIPASVMAKIQRKAEREWPDDYSMQEYIIDEQIEAYRKLHNQ